MKRALPTVIALLLIVLGFGYLFVETTPVGAVTGQVVFHRDGHPFALGAVALETEQDGAVRRWRSRTDAQGRFRFSHIPVGRYTIIPLTTRHHTMESGVTVSEAQTSTLLVSLATDEPVIQLAETQQRLFGTQDAPRLPVTGIGAKGEPLTVAVYRARVSDVMTSEAAAEALREVGSRWSDTNPALLHKSLQPFAKTPTASQTLSIDRTDREGYFTQRISLPDLKHRPGLYFVQVSHAQTSAWSWILVSDTALVTFRSLADKSLTAFAVDLEKGTPRVGATVRLFVNGREQSRATTDQSGLARLSALGASHQSTQRETAVVSVGEDEAIVASNSPLAEANKGLVGHVITDRTLYRPGQTIHFKALLRRQSPDDAYRIPAGEQAQVTVLDPSEVVLLRETRPVSASGAVTGEVTINGEGQTGYYRIEVAVGGQRIESSVELASYRKPEFEVTVTPKRKRVLYGEALEASLAAHYYFGAPVPNATVHWSLTRERDWESEAWDEDAHESGDTYGEYVASGTATLDATGHATLTLPTRQQEGEPHEPYQAETYTLSASIEDSAERSVPATAAVKVTTADLRVTLAPEGYLATKNTPTRLFASVADHEGKPLSGIALTVQAERTQPDPKTKKPMRTLVGPPLSATTGADGRAILAFTPTVAGDLLLVASAKDSGGRSATVKETLWVTTDSENEPSIYSSGLTLATDKKHYAPGETAKVVLGAAETGQTALVTIEGDRLYATIPVVLRQRVTVLRVPVKPEYGPNVSLHACYVARKQFAQSELPLRVRLPQKSLSVTITPEKPQYEPGQSALFSISVKDGQGKPVMGELSFSLADEALFALKADDPRALQRAFYPQRTSQIRTEHSFEVVYLAGDDKDGPSVVARKKFVDTAHWSPTLTTDASGHAQVSVVLPDNLTTWRATVQAITADTAVGYGRAKVVVNRPFFVRLDTPRFVVEGDLIRVQGLVHNNTGTTQTAHVRLAAPGITDPEKTLSVGSGAIGEATWEWKIPPVRQSAKLTLTGWTEDRRHTDGVEQALTVRPFSREEVQNLAADAEGKLSLTLAADALPDRSFVRVRVAPHLKEVTAEACDYLKKYPYGCVEQTVSRFVPLIAAGQADKALVAGGVMRLSGLLQGDNGWGWWYKDKADVFLTSYALWGLAEARDAGYDVPPTLLERGAKPLWAQLTDKGTPRPETAFALYALSRADAPRVRRLGVEALQARLARFGDPAQKRADTLAWLVLFTKTVGLDSAPYLAALEKKAITDGAFAHWNVPGERWSTTDRLTTALALRALLLAQPESPLLASGLRYLLSTATDGYFGDTRDTAFVISTLCQMPQYQAEDERGAAPQLLLNGKAVALQDQGLRHRTVTIPGTTLARGTNTLTLVGGGYATATLHSTRRTPSGPLPALDGKTVTVRREFVKLASGPKGLFPEAATTRFSQGDTVRVRLTIETKEPLEYVLLEDRFPAGFEPNARGTLDEEDTYGAWSFWYAHVDLRDDRLAVFARSLGVGKFVYEYHLRAQTPGLTHALPAALTPMYGAALRAESTGERIEIRP